MTRPSNQLSWDEEKSIHSELAALKAAHEWRERQEAYEAVSQAVMQYRWYGWSNILSTFRLLKQRIRWWWWTRNS